MYYNIKKNKKGIAFFYLLPVVVLLGFVALSVVISSQEDKIFDEEFSLIKNLDNIQSFNPKEEIFLETYIERFLDTSKSKFLVSKIRANLVDLNFVQDSDNFIGCEIDSKIYFYNEKNIKETDTNDLNARCLKDVNLRFDDEYKNYTSNEIEKSIKGFLDTNKISLELLEVKFNENNEINVLIQTKDSFENEVGKISQTRVYEFKNENSALEDLILDLYESFNGFSNKLNEEILFCYKENNNNNFITKKEDLENYCILKIYENSLDKEFKEKYEVKIKRDLNFVDENYLSLDFKVINKKNGKTELEFSTLFENKIPLGVLDYTLEESQTAQNTIELNIKNLDNNIEPEKYVIIYSYENFLNKATYSNYQNLIEMLQQSNLDENLDKFVTIEDDKLNYYNSKKDSNMGLSVMITSKDKFDVNSEKKLSLYQIYNFQTNSYELLESNREIYFLVFAVGSKDNYYSNEELLNSNLKSISVNKEFGPKPIIPLENTKTKTSFQNNDEFFEFEISNYYENDPIKYDLYVFKDSEIKNLDENGCSSYSNLVCEKVTSNELIDLNGFFLVTSLDFTQEEVSTFKYAFKLNSLKLEKGNRYNFLLIPVNSNGIGELTSSSEQYTYQKIFITDDNNENTNNENKKSYYIKNLKDLSSNRVTTFSVDMG